MKFARILALSGALTAVGVIGIAASAQNAATPAGKAPTGTPAAAPSAPSAAPAAAGTFKVDAVHSAVIFRIKHMNVSNFYGRFNKLSGSWSLEGTPSMEFTLDADSVDSGNSKRDDHLKSADFFNTKEFKTISFKSTGGTKKGENAYEVVGDLTLMGKTKPVTVAVTHTGTASGQRGTRSGIDATFTFKRSDFGMSFSLDSLGDEVTITAGVAGTAK